MKPFCLLAILLSSLHLVAQTSTSAATNPKVRAITAFVRLDQDKYQKEIADALAVLNNAKGKFESAGYEVESIRVTTQPLGEMIKGMPEDKALALLRKINDLSVKDNFLPNVGPGMMHDTDDPMPMHLLEQALSTMSNIEGSAIIADEDGIHWKTIHRTAELVKYVSERSARSEGTSNFTATAMLKPLSPFFPGSYHTGAGKQFAIGFEGANVVRDVFAKDKGNASAATADLTAALTKHTAVAEAVGNKVAAETGWTYVGVDPTPAPLGDVSIAAAIEAFTGAKFGSSGTLTAARIITAAVKAVPQKQIGYSGLMVPVMEDKLLSQRWTEGTYDIDSLLAYSAVCGTGLDTIPLPGDISLEQMDRIFSDVATLALKWNKPLSARLQPIFGKKAGDRTEFQDSYFFNTTLRALP
ncbi:MAG TPA: DUF711 family protein [Acidobacteriaceae bacterium]|jgi:uncharacterized protein (UPF0210 family)|nr:DUF711 family protein [Acidobacteriaceae bacterium]